MSNELDAIMSRADEIREHAPEGEKQMKLHDTSASILRGSGIMRMLQPKTHGGQEAHPREFAEAVMGAASLDGATGWLGGIVGVHPFELAMADPKVQEEVWGSDPDTWMASPYAPMGVAVPTDGGYILNGRWSFSSGTDHCNWLFIGAMEGDKDGNRVMPPKMFHVLVPWPDYEIDHDSWDVVGLRGTGSKDVIVKDAFIPTHRVLDAAKVMDGRLPKEMGLNQTLYNMPYWNVFPLGITAATVGIAEGALHAHVQAQKDRVAITGQKIKEDPYVLYDISEAASEIEASRSILLDNTSRFFDKTEAGKEIGFEERALARRDQIRAAHRAVNAVDDIMDLAGGGALHLRHPLQRFWRDAHGGLVHAVHVRGQKYHAAALTQLGGEPEGMMAAQI